jgi:hypothetical protein
MIRRAVILFGGALVLARLSQASEAGLVESSPFALPGNSWSAGDGRGASALELRGIMSTAEGVRFCIYDTGRKSSVWAAVREPAATFLIESADEANDRVTVESKGRVMVLRLRTARVISAPAEAAPAAGPAPTPPWTMTRRLPGEVRAPAGKPGA